MTAHLCESLIYLNHNCPPRINRASAFQLGVL